MRKNNNTKKKNSKKSTGIMTKRDFIILVSLIIQLAQTEKMCGLSSLK